jgi:hypothetical protein
MSLKKVGIWSLASISMFAYGQQTQPACENATHPVTEIGELLQIGATVPPDSSVFRISRPASRYVRARIELSSKADCDWYLTVRDGQLRPLQTFTQEDFRYSASRWTIRIPGFSAAFDLNGCTNVSQGPKLVLQEYIAMPESAEHPYYSSQDPLNPAFRNLYEQPPNVRIYGDFVGFMTSSWDRDSWTCSGVVIASDLFLTNWHCGAPRSDFPIDGYWSDQIIKDTTIDISWDGDEISREYYGVKRMIADPDLDFAILQMAPLNGTGRARPITLSRTPPKINDQIMVIHHPAARPKQISIGCTIVDANLKSWRKGVEGVDFGHRCDTEAGSSGAPVLNRDGLLVGLHHRGFDVDPRTCAQTDRINKAVRIDRILDFLAVHEPDLLEKLSIE